MPLYSTSQKIKRSIIKSTASLLEILANAFEWIYEKVRDTQYVLEHKARTLGK